MKKLLTGIALISILAIGAVAYAHGPGGRGGSMMGPGYGGHMMDQGNGGGHMRGWNNQGSAPDQKFLDETADLRKELHNKRFEYMEASRDPNTSRETVAELEKNIYELQGKVHTKAPQTMYGAGGRGSCW